MKFRRMVWRIVRVCEGEVFLRLVCRIIKNSENSVSEF